MELQFAFRNPLPEIRDLDAFDQLLREVGSYLDLFYVSRSIPVSVRFITTLARARVFQNPLTYGFTKDEAEPEPMRAVVKRRVADAQRRYDCMRQVLASGSALAMGFNEPPVFSLEEMPTLLHYLDGLFEALFDSADLPLLF